ncbi:MAG: hypothetical protein AAFZ15_33465 [Bacteroidota bacterium]
MKNLLSLVFFLSIILSSCSQGYRGFQTERLNGKVKSFTEYKYEAVKKSGQWEATKELAIPSKTVCIFDGKDIVEQSMFYELDGIDTSVRTIFKHDKKGNVISQIAYDAEGKENSRLEITKKDELGRVVEGLVLQEPHDTVSHARYEWENGRIKSSTFDQHHTRYTNVFIKEYNEQGLESGFVTKLMVDGALEHEGRYSTTYLAFDKKKNWIKKLDTGEKDGKVDAVVTKREIIYK